MPCHVGINDRKSSHPRISQPAPSPAFRWWHTTSARGTIHSAFHYCQYCYCSSLPSLWWTIHDIVNKPVSSSACSYGSVSLAHSLHSITIPQQNIVTSRQMFTNSPQAADSLPTPIVSTRPGRPRSTSTGLLPLDTQVSSDILTCWVEFCNTADASTEDYLQTQPWCGNLFSQRVGRGRPQLKVRCDCYFHCADDAHVARPCNYSTLCSMMPLLKGGACPGG